jgi:hypothetical protein
MAESVSIPARFNGPLENGNGGYTAGVVAHLLGGAAEVSLRSPVPLDRPLTAERDNGSVRLLDGDDLIAEGVAKPDFKLEAPAPVGVADARDAATRYRGLADGLFSKCFVCGRAREDAFGVFAGAVEGRDLVASPWTPPDWSADDDGKVLPEFVWAVLDCPTYFALYKDSDELPLSFLARLTGRIIGPVTAGDEHVVIAWPIEFDGRKHHAGSAVLNADGEVLAVAHALLIQARAD